MRKWRMDALRHAPFPERDIGFLSPTGVRARRTGHADRPASSTRPRTGRRHRGGRRAARSACVAGAAVAVGLIPGIGQVLAGGAPARRSSAAGAAGAALGTYLGPFIGMRHVDDTLAHRVEDELRGGRTVVTVHTADRVEDAMDLLHDHGAISVMRPE